MQYNEHFLPTTFWLDFATSEDLQKAAQSSPFMLVITRLSNAMLCKGHQQYARTSASCRQRLHTHSAVTVKDNAAGADAPESRDSQESLSNFHLFIHAWRCQVILALPAEPDNSFVQGPRKVYVTPESALAWKSGIYHPFAHASKGRFVLVTGIQVM